MHYADPYMQVRADMPIAVVAEPGYRAGTGIAWRGLVKTYPVVAHVHMQATRLCQVQECLLCDQKQNLRAPKARGAVRSWFRQ
jgi:hypothetical protein